MKQAGARLADQAVHKRPQAFYFEAILGPDQEIELFCLVTGVSAKVDCHSQTLVQIRQRDLQIAAIQVQSLGIAERLAVEAEERISRKNINAAFVKMANRRGVRISFGKAPLNGCEFITIAATATLTIPTPTETR